MLKSVEGRNDDTIITPNGCHVGRLDPVFKSEFPILEAQVIQDAPDHLLVQIVPAPDCNAATESAITEALAERTEGMRVDVRRVSCIRRGPNGKFKSVLRLPFESERQGSRSRESSAKGSAEDLQGPEHRFNAEEIRAGVDVDVAAIEEQISSRGSQNFRE